MKCRICENESHNTLHVTRDIRLGVKGQYEYIECSDCGCVQISNYPPDIERLYPPEYYAPQPLKIRPLNPLRNYLRTKWINYGMTGKGWMGRMLSRIKPIPQLYRMFGKYGIEKNSAILDIGCGSGTFLLWLARAGFKNITGIDPYIAGDARFQHGVDLFKRNVEDIDQQYDLITLNHSLEHMKDPVNVSNKLLRLLEDDRLLLISLPVIGFGWSYYGVNWVQLDPPRHFYVHTPKSFQILSNKAGLNIVDVSYNSSYWQFVGSELNRRNISERDLNGKNTKLSHLFTKLEISSFREKALALNKSGNGDQALFFLKKAKTGTILDG
jgi:SAM-dependent methyltransferase